MVLSFEISYFLLESRLVFDDSFELVPYGAPFLCADLQFSLDSIVIPTKLLGVLLGLIPGPRRGHNLFSTFLQLLLQIELLDGKGAGLVFSGVGAGLIKLELFLQDSDLLPKIGTTPLIVELALGHSRIFISLSFDVFLSCFETPR